MFQPHKPTLALAAESVVDSYTEVENHQVDDKSISPGYGPVLGGVEAMPGVMVPAHLKDLYVSAGKNCQGPDQLAWLGQLLVRYRHSFSAGDEDVGRTSEVEHSIPLKEGTRPIQQPPHHLVREKEEEAKRQVQVLLDRG